MRLGMRLEKILGRLETYKKIQNSGPKASTMTRKSSQNLPKIPPKSSQNYPKSFKIQAWRRLEASWQRPGASWRVLGTFWGVWSRF